MRRLAAAVCVVAASSLACGGEAERGGTAEPDRPASAQSGQLETTDGRLGDATLAGPGGPARELSNGGPPDPRPRPGRHRGSGVAEGADCPAREETPAEGNLAAIEQSILCLLNAERGARGLGALQTNADLARAAQQHARDMVERKFFAHTAPDGSDVASRVDATGYMDGAADWLVGENLAWGTGTLARPAPIVVSWMNSPGHRENILRAPFREIGISAVLGNPAGRTALGATYVTVFGSATRRSGGGTGGGGGGGGSAGGGTGSGGGGTSAGSGTRSDSQTSSRRRRSCRRKSTRKKRARCRARRAAARRAARRR